MVHIRRWRWQYWEQFLVRRKWGIFKAKFNYDYDRLIGSHFVINFLPHLADDQSVQWCSKKRKKQTYLKWKQSVNGIPKKASDYQDIFILQYNMIHKRLQFLPRTICLWPSSLSRNLSQPIISKPLHVNDLSVCTPRRPQWKHFISWQTETNVQPWWEKYRQFFSKQMLWGNSGSPEPG